MNSVLQDMADRGKLMDKDFVYKSHESPAPILDRGRGGMDGPSQTAVPAAPATNEDWDHPPASGRAGASDWDHAPASGPTPSNLTSAAAPPPAANGALSGACSGGNAFGDGYPSTSGN